MDFLRLLHSRWLRWFGLNICLAIAYAWTAEISLVFTTLPGTVASVWLPSGLTLGLILLFGNKILPSIALGSLWVISFDLIERDPNISIQAFFWVNFGCIAGNLVQPLLARFILKKYSQSRHFFNQVRGVLTYITAATLSPMASAFIGVTSIVFAERMEWGQYGLNWFTWWLASTLAHLIFTPVILLGKDFFSRKIPYHVIEMLLILAVFISVSWSIFIQSYPVAYLLLLILNWTVFRYGAFVSSLLVSIVSILAIYTTAHGLGVFVLESQNQSLLFLQSFMGVFALSSLLLSAVVEERSRAQASLKKALDNSTKLILERTKELRRSEALLRQTNQELQKLVHLDGLTQIANRRCFNQRLTAEWHRLYREQKPLALILFDVDYFKRYNDSYGHQQGDECLIQIAQAVKHLLKRPADLVARYGGEEFVVVLPNTTQEGATIVAKRIRRTVLELQIAHNATEINEAIVTVSLGVVSGIPQSQEKPLTFVKKADQALYLAKQQGRNRIVVAGESEFPHLL
ncbi:sensor domain-containing diguanylate cyclase [Picosynechococcus sp. PCC 73109]|uniref:sensor domain-containing diguanylate cyclase n=1 Tax=Picosynechococcus sp. PCC 73109 TaxID=374982 RepID=UPI0007457EDA|nr:diguanylate cyclase [Picosynechococcus sp. PCC 73109]AMA08619.1 PleD protein [Picosynechococcus sp. PCC 73109]